MLASAHVLIRELSETFFLECRRDNPIVNASILTLRASKYVVLSEAKIIISFQKIKQLSLIFWAWEIAILRDIFVFL